MDLRIVGTFGDRQLSHLSLFTSASYPRDETHLLTAVRYIEMNPVDAGLVTHPGESRWSSVRSHLEGKGDNLTKVAPMLEVVDNGRSFLLLSSSEELDLMQRHERTGRPLSKPAFVEGLEQDLGRVLSAQKPGLKKREK